MAFTLSLALDRHTPSFDAMYNLEEIDLQSIIFMYFNSFEV